MIPLSGQDAGFLYMETPAVHMHTLKVAVVDPSLVPGGYSFETFRRVLSTHFHRLPPFRRRLADVPLGLAHPLWIEDTDFDLDRHLACRHAPAPGGQRELCAIVSEIASVPLDRDHPLWQITAVDGLADGRVAFVAKIHHSLADGAAAFELLMNILHEPEEETAAAEAWVPEPPPSRAALLAYAVRSAGRHLAALPGLLWQTLRGLLRLGSRLQHPPVVTPLPFQTPITSFNASLSADRIFAIERLPLADLQAVKRAVGVKLNDVVLALCAGALRRYLPTHGGLPQRPLVVGVPTNTHPETRGRLSGNHVGNLISSLCTDVEDPIQRLRAIHLVTEEAKARMAALGPDILERWIEFAPPRPLSSLSRWLARHHVADRLHAPINLVVSNVPGPRSSQALAGARLCEIYSVGPILDGIGLNITCWSYGDGMHFAALACPQQVPDLERITDGLGEALEELLRACAEKGLLEEPST